MRWDIFRIFDLYVEENAMIVFVTVDVEGFHSKNPVDSLIYGRIGNEEYGINKIMNLCDSLGVQASFFIDVYECALHGHEAMRNIVENIGGRGHDVQLHTHPAWPVDERDEAVIQEWKRSNCPFDPKRPWMHQYALEEQADILRKGKELLEKWTGSEIIAHRAGGYGANRTTLKAAKSANLKMDFSAFRGHPNCRLITFANTIKEIDGIVEVPTTGFYRSKSLRFPKLPLRRRFVKTDIDWAFLDELKYFYTEGEKNGLSFMVLFMHSYSFLRMSPRFDLFEPNHDQIRKFEEFLRWAVQQGASFIAVKDFWNIYNSQTTLFHSRDYIPVYIKP